MRVVRIKDTGAPLVVLFAGWGMDETPFADFWSADVTSASGSADILSAQEYDFAVCCDYTDLNNFAISQFPNFAIHRVIAFSFGVWAASALFARFPELAAAPERIAINGTPYPIDDNFGIPTATFDATLANFSSPTLAKFERRMCGDAASLAHYQSRHPKRSLESLREELRNCEIAKLRNTCNFHFTHSIIGTRDAIFPPQNQHAAWAKHPSTKITTVDAPHYSDALLRDAVRGMI